jgi:hypothetical protein
MTAKDAIAHALKSTYNMVPMYLADLSDADLLVRAVPNSNHIAWQLGHLISSEQSLVRSVAPGTAFPELPAGFAQHHSPEAAKSDSNAGYLKKADYLALFEKTRNATMAALEKMSDADLDKATVGNMAKFAPTVGKFMLLVSDHTTMHSAQFTSVRRKLNKPVLF